MVKKAQPLYAASGYVVYDPDSDRYYHGTAMGRPIYKSYPKIYMRQSDLTQSLKRCKEGITGRMLVHRVAFNRLDTTYMTERLAGRDR